MVLATMKIPQLQFLIEVIDVSGMQVVQVLPSRLTVVCNDRCPAYVPQLQLINMVVYTFVVDGPPEPHSSTREQVEALEAYDASKPSSGSLRRSKKRKKKKLPRGGRAHRRQRQWLSMAGFAVLVNLTLYSLRLSAGLSCWASWTVMDQNDSTHGALVVDSGSGICQAGSAGFPHAVSLYVVVRPKMLRIMAGMNQMDSYAVGWFCWYCTSRCVPSCRRQATDACHHVRCGPEGAVRGAVQKTSDFPQLQFIKVVDFSCRDEEAHHHGCCDHRDSPVAVHTVVDVPVESVVRAPQLPFVRRQSCSHSCSSWRRLWRCDVVDIPVVTQRPFHMVQPVWRP